MRHARKFLRQFCRDGVVPEFLLRVEASESPSPLRSSQRSWDASNGLEDGPSHLHNNGHESKYCYVTDNLIGWPDAAQIITPALQKVWVGDATAEQALPDAVKEANQKLQDALTKKS